MDVLYVCERESVCVCEREREGGREYVCVCERERVEREIKSWFSFPSAGSTVALISVLLIPFSFQVRTYKLHKLCPRIHKTMRAGPKEHSPATHTSLFHSCLFFQSGHNNLSFLPRKWSESHILMTVSTRQLAQGTLSSLLTTLKPYHSCLLLRYLIMKTTKIIWCNCC